MWFSSHSLMWLVLIVFSHRMEVSACGTRLMAINIICILLIINFRGYIVQFMRLERCYLISISQLFTLIATFVSLKCQRWSWWFTAPFPKSLKNKKMKILNPHDKKTLFHSYVVETEKSYCWQKVLLYLFVWAASLKFAHRHNPYMNYRKSPEVSNARHKQFKKIISHYSLLVILPGCQKSNRGLVDNFVGLVCGFRFICVWAGPRIWKVNCGPSCALMEIHLRFFFRAPTPRSLVFNPWVIMITWFLFTLSHFEN